MYDNPGTQEGTQQNSSERKVWDVTPITATIYEPGSSLKTSGKRTYVVSDPLNLDIARYNQMLEAIRTEEKQESNDLRLSSSRDRRPIDLVINPSEELDLAA